MGRIPTAVVVIGIGLAAVVAQATPASAGLLQNRVVSANPADWTYLRGMPGPTPGLSAESGDIQRGDCHGDRFE